MLQAILPQESQSTGECTRWSSMSRSVLQGCDDTTNINTGENLSLWLVCAASSKWKGVHAQKDLVLGVMLPKSWDQCITHIWLQCQTFLLINFATSSQRLEIKFILLAQWWNSLNKASLLFHQRLTHRNMVWRNPWIWLPGSWRIQANQDFWFNWWLKHG